MSVHKTTQGRRLCDSKEMACDSVNPSPFSLENWSQWRPRTIEMSDSFYYLVSPLFAPRQTNFRTLNAASVGTDICTTLEHCRTPNWWRFLKFASSGHSVASIVIEWVMLLSLVKLIRTFYCHPREHFETDGQAGTPTILPTPKGEPLFVVVIGPWSIGTIIISTITSPPFLRGYKL